MMIIIIIMIVISHMLILISLISPTMMITVTLIAFSLLNRILSLRSSLLIYDYNQSSPSPCSEYHESSHHQQSHRLHYNLIIAYQTYHWCWTFITCFNLLSNCPDYCHIHKNQNHPIKSIHPSPLSPTDILPVKHIIGFGPFITCLNCHIHKNQNHRYLACQTYHWHWSCPACCNLPGSGPIE